MTSNQTIDSDVLANFKAVRKCGWALFAPLESSTTAPAARLVSYASVRDGQLVLDMGCGTGVVAVTAARVGGRVTGLDLTPELLERAAANAAIAGVEVEWREGDVETMPFGDAEFDVVLSQFGHMFALRADLATAEMLRVLKPGGTLLLLPGRPSCSPVVYWRSSDATLHRRLRVCRLHPCGESLARFATVSPTV